VVPGSQAAKGAPAEEQQ
jgi:hypothetical protein